MIWIIPNFFTLAGNIPTRGHSFKLFKPHSLQDIRAHVFSQQVINDWNKLDPNIVTAPSLSIFKQLYDKYCSNHLYDAGL